MLRNHSGAKLAGGLVALALALGLCRGAIFADAPAAKPVSLYSQDFENAKDGDPPSDMVILNGAFAVKADVSPDAGVSPKANRLLELPGEPADGFGILFGPADKAELCVSARVRASAVGRRFPEFGVGLGDSGGYKLLLAPAVGELQLIKGDEVVARAKTDWASGRWTAFRLQIRKRPDGKFAVEGKAWPADHQEGGAWAVSYVEAEAPQPGHASAWGSPYSGTPIQFDDLVVTAPGE